MANSLMRRLRAAWDVFRDRDAPEGYNASVETSRNPSRVRITMGNERSIINSVFNRIAMDVSAIGIRHVKLDSDGRYLSDIDSPLQTCLTSSANIDQTGRQLILDGVLSMLDEGIVAFVPVETSDNPYNTGSYDILSIRTAKVVSWMPEAVRVDLLNEQKGRHEQIVLPKSMVAIVENPFYTVINERNSTMQRLIRKLALLDVVDNQSGSNKLDVIVQLPYSVRSQLRKEHAEERRIELERQLSDSKYGVAYVDATERITQLNRPVENNLLSQVEYLTNMLYSQLGITQEVMSGTASDAEMNNYYVRTIYPFLTSITEEFERKFLTKTARTQGQAIRYFPDPFSMIPPSQLAETLTSYIAGEMISRNEARTKIGLKPVSEEGADTLSNPNVSQPSQPAQSSEDDSQQLADMQQFYEEGQNA